ncbi:MAG: helix-turn-helix transcriptional regulator [Eggerthellaceae bacterium]|nr:helix-turn-helix transcriptional regulator [Eggerthellaceae bacterium]
MTTQKINEKLGAWLIEDKSHTRNKLAEELGMTRPTLQNRLNGTSKWEWEEVVRVSQLTGCTLNELAEVDA